MVLEEHGRGCLMLQAAQRRRAEGWKRQCTDAFDILQQSMPDLRHSCQGPPQASLELRSLLSHSVGTALTFRPVDTLGATFNLCSEELVGKCPWLPFFRRTMLGGSMLLNFQRSSALITANLKMCLLLPFSSYFNLSLIPASCNPSQVDHLHPGPCLSLCSYGNPS